MPPRNYLVLPFEITMPNTGSVWSFRDSRTNDALDGRVRDKWRDDGDAAAVVHRDELREVCEPDGYDDSIAFEVKRDGDPFGTFGLYAITPIQQNKPFIVSAMPAPTIRGLLNKDEASRDNFWRRVFYVMEWMVDNPMATDAGLRKNLTIDHWRLPDADQGGCAQHEWIGLEAYEQRHATKVFEYNANRGNIPIRMLKQQRP